MFGNGVTDVAVSQGAIVVSYSNKSVKLYSFEHILQRVCMVSFFSYIYVAPYSPMAVTFYLCDQLVQKLL